MQMSDSGLSCPNRETRDTIEFVKETDMPGLYVVC